LPFGLLLSFPTPSVIIASFSVNTGQALDSSPVDEQLAGQTGFPMAKVERVLVLHDGDLIGKAVVVHLQSHLIPIREADGSTPADELVARAFGCRGIIAVGDRFVSDRALFSAAEMPGVRRLVLVTRADSDLMLLRKRGVPYTVLRVPSLWDEVVDALSPALESGRLVLETDPEIASVAAADVAACAAAALDLDDACGRVLSVASPTPSKLSELAKKIAAAQERRLKVSSWPKWVRVAMRALGRAPFRLPDTFAAATAEDLSWLHPGPWEDPGAQSPSDLQRSA
jgi:hypothetical protein